MSDSSPLDQTNNAINVVPPVSIDGKYVAISLKACKAGKAQRHRFQEFGFGRHQCKRSCSIHACISRVKLESNNLARGYQMKS